MGKRGRLPFQFSAAELTALTISFCVTMVLVFTFGFYLGKRNAAEHGPVGERVARIPIKQEAQVTPFQASVEQDITEAPAAVAAGSGASAAALEKSSERSKQRSTAAGSVKKPPARSSAETVPEAPERSVGGAYSVQVLATRRSDDAADMVRSLKRRGYDAYVRKVKDGQGWWYRVRIGSFPDIAEARLMAKRCRQEKGMEQAYVTTY